MTDINREIKYLYFYLDGDEIVSTEIQICAKDEANSGYLSAPSRRVLADVKRSQYIRLHYSGEVSSLMISVSGLAGKTIQSLDIVLNENVPILFFVVPIFGTRLCNMPALFAESTFFCMEIQNGFDKVFPEDSRFDNGSCSGDMFLGHAELEHFCNRLV